MNGTGRPGNRPAPGQCHLPDASAGVASLLSPARWWEEIFKGCHRGIDMPTRRKQLRHASSWNSSHMTEPMAQRFSCFPSQFRLRSIPNYRFCQLTVKCHTDLSARISIVLVKLIKLIWYTSLLFFYSVIFPIRYLAARNNIQENSEVCGFFFYMSIYKIKSIKKRECNF